MVAEVGGRWGILVVLCVCYGLVFYIHFSRCLVPRVLGIGLYNDCGTRVHKRVSWRSLMQFSLFLLVCCSNV